ncbi:dicarboxylate/amino acid:cation symporter [Cellvibrio japonicus]|uniref:Proton/glutamate symporter n=1 Tax=Cellvibrio japonicus (strain Ueda107) TaxID=498211 RepID=B3PG99_CELJU|nr:dicarboxylate/amino acid:cation symporter [Cellvibrio japonicus]ACE82666.1 proton/glutamate symporter [Cellvibrio japonicus Ueda107]QEI10901.1 dicarboxylate/amino acid:cation symporter [Cellvibrio japonicus]QEI14477.1 dicarboxylate/amino acid:cation symporter [Cellvibrio japonicus]QEI18055.1 dicarboxylate/amino acid:cation symporter [Cellvibrio japonicus]
MSLTTKILIGMLLGFLLGAGFNLLAGVEKGPDGQLLPLTGVALWLQTYLIEGLFDALGQIFIASLKLLVVPMVFVSLVCGAAALGGHSRMGIMAGKTVIYYTLTSVIALTLAVGFALLIQPGAGVQMDMAVNFTPPESPSIKSMLIDIFPSNPVAAMVEANMLQIIVFAILFGIAISRTTGESGKVISSFFNSLNDVVISLVMLLMQFAPYGVFCLLVKLFSQLGFGAILDLAKYFFTVLFVLLLHGVVIYGLLIRSLTGLSPVTFFKKQWKVMLFAFSTATSSATMPFNMRVCRDEMGVDNKIASFAIPLGATINMDGTSIMQGVAAIFIAQAFGIDLGIGGYLMIILTATLASIGTAGVPSVGLVTLAMVLQSVGLPVEGIALIIGVDRLLDMTRTAVNITGDSVGAIVVAKSEGMLDEERYRDMNASMEGEPIENAGTQTPDPVEKPDFQEK